MTLTLAVGTTSQQVQVINGKMEPRDMLHLTLSADHQIIDGGPLVRFQMFLKSLIEECAGLEQLTPEELKFNGRGESVIDK